MSVGSVSTLGVGSGLELQSILDDLRGVDEKQRIEPLERNITSLQSQLEAFSVLQNKLLDMRGHARNLSLESNYLQSTVTTGDETVLTATAYDGTAVQSANVEVERLASKSSWLTSGLESRDAVINDTGSPTTFEYRVANGDTVSVELAPGATITQLAELINSDAANPGVTAKIIDNGAGDTPIQLLIQANETGSNNAVVVSALPADSGLSMTRQEGDDPSVLNARIKLDGISYLRQGNSFDDVMPGVSFNLQKTGTTSVAVATDNGQIRDFIVGMVEVYNEAVQEIGANVRYSEETGEAGLLARTTVQGLRYELQDLMTAMLDGDESGTVRSLFDLGMEFQRDGSISLNTVTLDEMLAEKGTEVKAFLLGDSERGKVGFADRLNDRLGSIASFGGTLATEKDTAENRIKELELRVTSETERLSRQYAVLTRRFVELDSYMSQMTNMAGYLESQFDSLSSLSSGKKR